MARHGLFTKELYIRLADDGTGFLYSVKYGPLGLPTRRIRLFEESENVLEVTKTPDCIPHAVPSTPAGEGAVLYGNRSVRRPPDKRR
jgi:hypothetical protein